MDILEALSQEILEKAAPRIAAAVVAEVVSVIKHEAVFRYSEEEAAAKLGISPATLAQIRKDQRIEFTYSVLPSFGTDRKLHGGRISYLPRHLDEYLARNEQKYFFTKLKAA